MKESANDVYSNMQAVSSVREQSFQDNFSITRNIPENLKNLDIISQNFYWSWTTEGVSLFQDLDARLWERCEQNPRKLLREIGELRLWQKACEADYVQRVNDFAEKTEKYLLEEPKTLGKITSENPVAYFCAEYGMHNSLPIYSGGLGILAGDHLKSASDMNVPLVAIGLFYRYGYFRQIISHEGWQEERYLDTFENSPALELVRDGSGNPLTVGVYMRGREVFAQVWLAKVGRIPLYLLDTNLEENLEIDRYVTGHLYGGDTETRIVQEKLLGIGGVRLLRKLGITPSVYHLNEGHSALLTLELVREKIASGEAETFEAAAEKVREKCVFTTHTPVAAGNDVFNPELLASCFKEDYPASLGLTREQFIALGRAVEKDTTEWFGMTPLAIKMTRSANGVSEKHGEVSRELWHKMFPEKSSRDVPILFVTNGVHPPTWIAPVLKSLYEKHIGENWQEVLKNKEAWSAAVEKIPDDELWQTHLLLKNRLIAFIRQKTYSKETGNLDTINEHSDTARLFNPNYLTVGFARRVAAYKRWNLLLSDVERLYRMINDQERPVQFVFAGKAHPQDRNAKALLQRLMTQKENPSWQNHAVFIEDYDQEVARYLVQGVDVWMNVPRRPMEASGTSGEKAAMNGGLNFSILDGWWIEGYDGINGFSIGVLKDEEGIDDGIIDAMDAESLYTILENEIIPAYYQKGADGLPTEWIKRFRRALQTLTPQFSSDRMLKDYIEKIYLN